MIGQNREDAELIIDIPAPKPSSMLYINIGSNTDVGKSFCAVCVK